MVQEPVYILAFLCALIFISEWLIKNTFLKPLSAALLVILLGAIFANIGWIPSASNASPVYDAIFTYVAPASIFYLLLGVRLKALRKAGAPMLLAFSLGAVGTVLGVLVAIKAVDVQAVFGENYAAIAGMMAGSYTGGSANFNAVALHFGMVREGAVFTGLVVADNIITALWMLVTLSLPALMLRLRPHGKQQQEESQESAPEQERESLGTMRFALMLAMGLFVVWFSDALANQLNHLGISIPSILILTTLALLLAQWKSIQNLPGAKVLGLFTMHLFLVVVGAFCELGALGAVGQDAASIVLFTAVIVLVHGLFFVLAALLLKSDWHIVAIASQANIGGAGTAIALAKSFKRSDLLLPAILAGALGTALGTYIGFAIAFWI